MDSIVIRSVYVLETTSFQLKFIKNNLSSRETGRNMAIMTVALSASNSISSWGHWGQVHMCSLVYMGNPYSDWLIQGGS